MDANELAMTTPYAVAAVVLFVTWVAASPAWAQDPFRTDVDPACEQTLPTHVVQAVSGEPDIRLVPRDPRRGADGTCNYATGGQDLILMVAVNTLSTPTFYESYRRNCGHEQPPTAIADLGEEALACRAYGGGGNNAVVVRQGHLVVLLQSSRKFDHRTNRLGGHVFTTDQLTELARVVMKKL